MTAHPEVVTARRDIDLSARIVESWPLSDVRAGSGLAWHGSTLVAVQDDAYAAVRIDPRTRRTAAIVLAGDGRALSKAEKPDFEAIARDAHGGLWLFGSGSAPGRRRLARLDLDHGGVALSDAAALYEAAGAALGCVPNIEGAVFLPSALRLFHRGAAGQPSMTVDLALDAAGAPVPRALAVVHYDLGRVGQVPLTFTDATADIERGSVAYLAVAEDTPNAIDDGPVVGAAIGFLTAHAATWAPIVEADGRLSVRKFEGLALTADGAYVITDADDPARPAELCRLVLAT